LKTKNVIESFLFNYIPYLQENTCLYIKLDFVIYYIWVIYETFIHYYKNQYLFNLLYLLQVLNIFLLKNSNIFSLKSGILEKKIDSSPPSWAIEIYIDAFAHL